MNTYLLAIGWWNLVGSILMLGLFNEQFGKKIFNEWCKIISTEYKLDYWGKFWLSWAIGTNIFFALINILSVKWGYNEIKTFLIWFDIIAYLILICFALWGIKAKRTGIGIYIGLIIFVSWVVGGLFVVV
jgi:hypothetical protein